MTNLADGNGRIRVARRPLVGVPSVVRFLNAMSWFWDGVGVQWVTTNGQTSAALRRDGAVHGLLTVSVSTEGIEQLLWMVNPEKNTAAKRFRGLSMVAGEQVTEADAASCVARPGCPRE